MHETCAYLLLPLVLRPSIVTTTRTRDQDVVADMWPAPQDSHVVEVDSAIADVFESLTILRGRGVFS